MNKKGLNVTKIFLLGPKDEGGGGGVLALFYCEYSKVAPPPPSPANLVLKKLVNYPSFLGRAEEEEPEGALGHQAGGGQG